MVAALSLSTLVSNWPPPPERGHELMCTWALYRRDASRKGLLPHEGHMPWREQLDRATDAEPVWLVRIDRMIGDLNRSGHEVYEPIIKRFWLDNQAIWEIAPKVQRTEGFVWLAINGICELAERRVGV